MGKEDTEKATKLLREKGTIYFPAFMIFPLFPDDALCCVAGIIKMNPLFYGGSIVLCRGIGVATIVFGLSLIPFERFTTIYDWLVCITVLGIWIIAIFFGLHKLNVLLDKKRKEKNNG